MINRSIFFLWVVALTAGLWLPRVNAQGTTGQSQPEDPLGRAIRERAVWQNNRLGITDRIPPPWTPIVVHGQPTAPDPGRKGPREPLTASCWGRVYDLGGSLFPARIRSQSAELLAGPIALAARVGGREFAIHAASRQRLATAPHQVDVDSTAAVAGLSVRTCSHLEFDGCLRIELELAPVKEPVLIQALELRTPVRTDRALYYHWFEATRDPRLTNAGALPSAGLRSHFKPLLWLGDDDRGLCWFCESPRGWAIRDREGVLQVARGAGGTTLMRIRMADRPFVIAGAWRVVFGLMATPTRPVPPGWRDWLIPLNQSNPWSAWHTGFFNNLSGTDDPGTLTPKDPEALRRAVAEAHVRGPVVPFLPMREPARVIPYSQIVFWSGKHRDGTLSPEIQVFGPEWSNRAQPPGPRRESEADIPLKEYYWVCPASSFAQFYIYRLNQLVDQTGIDGIYIDGPWNTCSNPIHGCGYADERGQWQPEFKIWAYRELLKRVYCLLYEKRPDPIVHHHTSCWLCIPCVSFSHMMLDGEQYHDPGQKVEASFLDVVPLDKWRAEHAGRQWGPAPFLLPDIPAKWCADEKATRELLMLTNLHDTGLFPAGNNLRVVMRNYQARRLFGVADCEFRGYWDRAAWARAGTPGAYVSAYLKPDRIRCLLVVGNTNRRPVHVRLRIIAERLRLAGGIPEAGVDIETGERIPIRGGVAVLPVRGRDYRLVALPYYQPPPITAGDVRATGLRGLPNPGFEQGLSDWTVSAIEGSTGWSAPDTEVRFSGAASCHLHKPDGPGGVMLATENVVLVEAAKRYRVSCRLRTANLAGCRAYWMISQQDAQGNGLGTNNLFSEFVIRDQDWQPFPFEFGLLPGAAAIRVHFLIAFPGAGDAWIDDLSLEEVR